MLNHGQGGSCRRFIRHARIIAVFAALLSCAATVQAQTIVDPHTVSFSPSSDHNATGSDGQPMVTRYDLEFFLVGGTQPILTLSLGKPSPAADGDIYVDFSSMMTSYPAPGQSLVARVAAVGPGGTGESAPSNTFMYDACTFVVAPSTVPMAASAGSSTFGVTTAAGCGWQATSNASWVTLTSGASGSGNGTVTFTVAANAGASRTGTITTADQTTTITQAAGSVADTTPPTVTISTPTTGSTYTASATPLTVGGSASDNVGVTQVSWTNSAGGSGTATGKECVLTDIVRQLPKTSQKSFIGPVLKLKG